MNPNKRPFPYKLLLFTLALITIAGILRSYQTIYQWKFLQYYGLQPGPWYTLLSGIIIAISALIGLVGGWREYPWSSRYIRILILVLAGWWWLDYLLLTRDQTAFYNLPFRVFITTFYLAFVFLVLATRKKRGERIKNEK